MRFDVAQTPTLEAVAIQDGQELSNDLRKRADESIELAVLQPEVAEAVGAQLSSEEYLRRLQKAERVLSQRARELRDQLLASRQAALDALIESATLSSEPDFTKLLDLATIENQDRHANGAIQRIVEHLIPLAQIARLRAESHALLAKARAIEGIAHERAEKVLEQLRRAVTEEVVLPVDMSKGVVGALVTHAKALKRSSIQHSENADQIEKSYCERQHVVREQ